METVRLDSINFNQCLKMIIIAECGCKFLVLLKNSKKKLKKKYKIMNSLQIKMKLDSLKKQEISF